MLFIPPKVRQRVGFQFRFLVPRAMLSMKKEKGEKGETVHKIVIKRRQMACELCIKLPKNFFLPPFEGTVKKKKKKKEPKKVSVGG